MAYTFTVENFGKFCIVSKVSDAKTKNVLDWRCGLANSDVEPKVLYSQFRNSSCVIGAPNIIFVNGSLVDIQGFHALVNKIFYSNNEEMPDIKPQFNFGEKDNYISDSMTGYKTYVSNVIVDTYTNTSKILSQKFDTTKHTVTMFDTDVIIDGKNYLKGEICEYFDDVILNKKKNHEMGYELLFDGVFFVFGPYKFSVKYILDKASPVPAKINPPAQIQQTNVAKTNDFKSIDVAYVQDCDGFELITYIDGSYKVVVPNFSGNGDFGIIRGIHLTTELIIVVNGEKKYIKNSDILYGARVHPCVYFINNGKPLFLVTACKREERFSYIDGVLNS